MWTKLNQGLATLLVYWQFWEFVVRVEGCAVGREWAFGNCFFGNFIGELDLFSRMLTVSQSRKNRFKFWRCKTDRDKRSRPGNSWSLPGWPWPTTFTLKLTFAETFFWLGAKTFEKNFRTVLNGGKLFYHAFRVKMVANQTIAWTFDNIWWALYFFCGFSIKRAIFANRKNGPKCIA